MFLTIYSPRKVTCLILEPHYSVTTTEVVSSSEFEMAKGGKGKGPREAKVPKVTDARATRSSSAGSHPQRGRRNSEDGPCEFFWADFQL